MTDFIDAMCWGLFVSNCAFGWFAGWYYAKHQWCRKCLGATLFILWKMDKRGVFLTPYDRAVIQTAANHIRETK